MLLGPHKHPNPRLRDYAVRHRDGIMAEADVVAVWNSQTIDSPRHKAQSAREHDRSRRPWKGRSAVRGEGDEVSAYRDLGLSAVTVTSSRRSDATIVRPNLADAPTRGRR